MNVRLFDEETFADCVYEGIRHWSAVITRLEIMGTTDGPLSFARLFIITGALIHANVTIITRDRSLTGCSCRTALRA